MSTKMTSQKFPSTVQSRMPQSRLSNFSGNEDSSSGGKSRIINILTLVWKVLV